MARTKRTRKPRKTIDKLETERITIVRFALRYEGTFYKRLGALIEVAGTKDLLLIYASWWQWWERCLDRAAKMAEKGVELV